MVDLGANSDLQSKDIDQHEQLIEKSDVVLSPLEIPVETAMRAADLAHRRGIQTILNPAPAMNLTGLDLSCISVLTPNEAEARVCLGLSASEVISEEDVARRLLALGPSNVVITLGARGALWASKDGLHRFPVLSVPVLDTVGAGDVFNSGLATGLSEKRSFEESLEIAIITASLSTRKPETVESYPFRAEVESYLN